LFRNPTRKYALVATCAIAVNALAASALPNPKFDAPWIGYDTSIYPEGIGPWGSAVEDFDGDGDDDLATVSWGGTAFLSLLRSDGAGGYEPPETTPLFIESLDLAAGDFDRDGDIDLVVSDTGRFWEGLTVSLYENDGNGHFTFSGFSPAGINGPSGITADDFNGDGWLDVAVAHDEYIEFGNTAAVLLNDQNGGFTLLQLILLSSGTREIDSGDLDGDGDSDLVVAHETNRFSVLMNVGGGVMVEDANYDGLDGFIAELPDTRLEDIDLDGDLDILYSNSGTGDDFGAVGLWRNQGDATFSQPETLQFSVSSSGGHGIHTADVTGDGWPDVLSAAGSTDNWFLFASDGAGGFAPAQGFRAGETPFRIETPDLDLDGDLDLMVMATGSLEACVYLNPGDGSFIQPPVIDMTEPELAPAFPTNIQAGDIDVDGDLDIVLGYRSDFSEEDGITVRRNTGTGDFLPIEKYIETTHPLSIRLGDLDLDGDLDLVWLDANADIKRRSNDGSGMFGSRQTIRRIFGADFMNLFDIESDGDLDIVVAAGFEVSVILNDGGGAFGAPIDTGVGGFFNVLGMGEFNGDGHLDLLTDSAVQGYAEISNGNGDGTFDGANTVVTGRDVHAFATDDLDQDNALDFVALYNLDEKGVSVLRGRGIGDFFPVQNFHSSFGSYDQTSSLQIADVDDDGILDAASAAFSPQDLAFWRGVGDGSFERLERYGVAQPAQDVALGDFDGDGLTDAAVATQTDSGRWWYPGVVLLRGLPTSNQAPFELTVSDLRAGEDATWSIRGAEPGETVRFLATSAGLGDGPCPGRLGGLCLDILEPILHVGSVTADASGDASVTVSMPSDVPPGAMAQSQAVIVRGNEGGDSVKSAPIESEVLP